MCQILYNAKRIFMYGTGSLQKSVCREFQRMMLSLNILVNDIPAEGEVRKVVKLMKPDDIFFVVSKSGESDFIRNIMIQANS
ncbi:SIS domain-containing protein, partial [Bacteroides caccae]|uniref:SIS domain-containing protein n=1 Tax=Bacteroides caccae TaxID=47678 RepID=UPI00293D800E